jgi:hypothetical protein
MAPEEILSSADSNRRDFLKKVLAGTTFAAPVIASFSMEGLSPENAWAFTPNQTSNQSFCSNMPTSPCCAFAAQIAADIWRLGLSFIPTPCVFFTFLPTPEVAALLLGQMGKAQAAMADGIEKGKGDCNNKPARDQFKKAGKEMDKFEDLVESLCQGPFADELINQADAIIGQINDLLNGNCTFPI